MSELAMWVVYDNPTDAPGWYMARKHLPLTVGPTLEVIQSRELEGLRFLLMAKGLTRIGRDPADEPHILEVWL